MAAVSWWTSFIVCAHCELEPLRSIKVLTFRVFIIPGENCLLAFQLTSVPLSHLAHDSLEVWDFKYFVSANRQSICIIFYCANTQGKVHICYQNGVITFSTSRSLEGHAKQPNLELSVSHTLSGKSQIIKLFVHPKKTILSSLLTLMLFQARMTLYFKICFKCFWKCQLNIM